MRINRATLSCAIAALLMVAAISPIAAAPALIPPRAVRVAEHHYRARGSFRRAVLHVRRALRRTAGAVQRVPIYRWRGVTVARFISKDAATSWLAIHVYEHGGATYVHIVPRPKPLDETREPG